MSNKMKTHKGVKKRVRISARGKVKYRQPNAGHLLSGKRAKRRRQLRQPGILDPAFAERIRCAVRPAKRV